MSYRFDNRSKEQFIEDIAKRTATERSLMERYVVWLNASGNAKYTYIDNGIDNSGKFIENDGAVKADADFILYKNGSSPRRIEIKHCLPDRDIFHLKVPHVERCVKDDVCIVNWMGVSGEKPRFCILTPSDLKKALENGKRVIFWKKPCIRFECGQQKWIYE